MTSDNYAIGAGGSNLQIGDLQPKGRPIAFLFATNYADMIFATKTLVKTAASWETKKTAIKANRCWVLPIPDSAIAKEKENVVQAKTMAEGDNFVTTKGETLSAKIVHPSPELLRRFNWLRSKYVYGYYLFASGCIDINSSDGIEVQPRAFQLQLQEKEANGTEPAELMINITAMKVELNNAIGYTINFSGSDVVAEELILPIIPVYHELISANATDIEILTTDSDNNPVSGWVAGDLQLLKKSDLSTVAFTLTPVAGSNKVTLEGTFTAVPYLFSTKSAGAQTMKTHESQEVLEFTPVV